MEGAALATGLSVKNLSKYYGKFQALKNVSFDIKPGNFVTLLGPSGCGKTTLLRTIAGFLEADEGEIYFGDKLMNDVPPNKRDTAMCFQSYALFPNKTVYENIRFGLRMHKVPKEDHEKRVKEAMEMVNLQGLEKRKPYELSGGQQQRVALARCIVVRPQILLFDEPLSNLDAKLREKVRVEIREVQQSTGITAIYVTHDQAEALAISDRIITMNQGVIVQNDDPRSIYDRPNSRYVADFIGTANIYQCTILERQGNHFVVDSAIGKLYVIDNDCRLDKGAECSLLIRPEDLTPLSDADGGGEKNRITGNIHNAVYMGNALDLFVIVNDKTLRANISKDFIVKEGTELSLTVKPEKVRLLEA